MPNQKPLAARLNKVVTIQSKVVTQDSEAGLVETWSTYAIERASIVPLNGSEYFQSQQFVNKINYRIRVRYSKKNKSITPSMRVSWDGRLFDIESVINPMESNKEIILMCSERL